MDDKGKNKHRGGKNCVAHRISEKSYVVGKIGENEFHVMGVYFFHASKRNFSVICDLVFPISLRAQMHLLILPNVPLHRSSFASNRTAHITGAKYMALFLVLKIL